MLSGDIEADDARADVIEDIRIDAFAETWGLAYDKVFPVLCVNNRSFA